MVCRRWNEGVASVPPLFFEFFAGGFVVSVCFLQCVLIKVVEKSRVSSDFCVR